MTEQITYAYAGDIEKSYDEDGELIVVGKATGPDLDLDEQICDPAWLREAMPAWMKFGNLREMHQPVAAGVGLELTAEGDDWHLKSKVVDPMTRAKVEAGALTGYSIGIKGAKVVKDANALGGRIIGGTVVEVSYVDRPCNPTAVTTIAKGAGLEQAVEAAEAERTYKYDDNGTVGAEWHPEDTHQTDQRGATPSSKADEYPDTIQCSNCDGLGKLPETGDECPTCKGSGQVDPDERETAGLAPSTIVESDGKKGYNPDQERDDHGRWGDGGSASQASNNAEKASDRANRAGTDSAHANAAESHARAAELHSNAAIEARASGDHIEANQRAISADRHASAADYHAMRADDIQAHQSVSLETSSATERAADAADRAAGHADLANQRAYGEGGPKGANSDTRKRDYSASERASAAESGAAMPGGGFPIKTVADLRNAIQAIGRAKDRAATIAHIKDRASALGREDLIPEAWKGADADLEKVEHDAGDLEAVRSAMISLIKAELDEMLSGEEDEIGDVSQLLCSLQMFLSWWEGESDEGETAAPFTTQEEESEMDLMHLGVSADTIKAVKAGEAEPATIKDELVKALGIEDLRDEIAKAAQREERLELLEAELERVKTLAAPGGPAITRTQAQAHKSAEVERIESDAARYFKMAESVEDPSLASQYRTRAEQMIRDASKIANA